MAAPRAAGIRPGPMSVLVLTLCLCLAVLAALALTTAAAAGHRAEVQASMTADGYENERCAQELLAEASDRGRSGGAAALAALADGVPGRWEGAEASFADGTLSAEFRRPSGRTLSVELGLAPDGSVSVTAWRPGTLWEEPSTGLWQGP